jgi:hypothetical protein
MAESKPRDTHHVVVKCEHLEDVLRALSVSGYTLIGPTVRDGAIVYDRITSAGQLPAGWADEQEAATYRLHHDGSPTVFDHTAGPHAWKKFLSPPTTELWRLHKSADGLSFDSAAPCGDSDGIRRSACLRPCGDRYSGPGVPGGVLPRSRLCVASQEHIHCCGQLHPRRQYVLLRINGNWPARHATLRSGTDRNFHCGSPRICRRRRVTARSADSL